MSDQNRQRAEALRKLIADLRTRQDRLLDELETPPEDMDEDTRKAFRQRLHERFADLAKQLKTRQDELAQLNAATMHVENDTMLLDELPQIGDGLRRAPEAIQRDIYDSFRLEILYSHRRHEATLKVTITDESAASVTRAIDSVPANESADLLGAPNGITRRRMPVRPGAFRWSAGDRGHFHGRAKAAASWVAVAVLELGGWRCT